jgi:hypothetical protein
MKMKKFIFALMSIFLATAANAQDYYYDDGYGGYDYLEPDSTVVAHDYLYDYNRGQWVRVNSYVDYMPCWEASQLVFELRDSGFNVSYHGRWDCPSRISYGVFHDSFYVASVDYHNYWVEHHHAFHHYGVKVYFHLNISHNRYHHYHGHSVYYSAKPRYKRTVRTKYRKWKKYNKKGIPVYYKNKKKVTYKKYSGKKKYNSSYKKSKYKGTHNKKKYKGTHKKKYKGTTNKRKNYQGKSSHKRSKGYKGGQSRPQKPRGQARSSRGSKKGGKFAKRGGSHRGHKSKGSRGYRGNKRQKR